MLISAKQAHEATDITNEEIVRECEEYVKSQIDAAIKKGLYSVTIYLDDKNYVKPIETQLYGAGYTLDYNSKKDSCKISW